MLDRFSGSQAQRNGVAAICLGQVALQPCSIAAHYPTFLPKNGRASLRPGTPQTSTWRLIDHIVVMTRGGPDNATSLLLFYIYETGFKFWDSGYASALTMVLLALLALIALAQFVLLERRTHYQ
jgi:hypothetical protein